MKIKERTVYSCDFCNKKYFRKNACLKHENICSRNPINHRDCFDCTHLKTEEIDLHFDTPHGTTSEKRTIFYCQKVNQFLYPPITEFKGSAYLQEDINDGNVENEPMKKKGMCSYFNTSIFNTDF